MYHKHNYDIFIKTTGITISYFTNLKQTVYKNKSIVPLNSHEQKLTENRSIFKFKKITFIEHFLLNCSVSVLYY